MYFEALASPLTNGATGDWDNKYLQLEMEDTQNVTLDVSSATGAFANNLKWECKDAIFPGSGVVNYYECSFQ